MKKGWNLYMFNEKTLQYFKKNSQFMSAPKNDVIVPCRFFERKLDGIVDIMCKFVEENNLLDRKKWKLFVLQFSIRMDSDNEGWRGEYWGKMMRGASITYLYTRNKELYDILTETVVDLLETQDEFGRIATYSVEKEYRGCDIWCRKYVILGLLHYLEICEDDVLKNRIIEALKKHLDYMVNTIGEDKLPINETSSFYGAANSVSLLEPVVRMYNQTGEKNILILLITSSKQVLRISIFLKKLFLIINHLMNETEVSITGCCGCRHELFNNGTATQTDPNYPHPIQETCVTVTWIKLCYQLLRLTGDVIYADEIEKSVYNALYGAVNTEHSSLNGGFVFDSSESGIVFNLYAKGEYSLLTPPGNKLNISVNTQYPLDGKVVLTINPEIEQEFVIMLRIPEFSKNTKLLVNDQELGVKERYVKIFRRWCRGDKINLQIDMSPRVCHPIGCYDDPETLKYIAVKISAHDSEPPGCPDFPE